MKYLNIILLFIGLTLSSVNAQTIITSTEAKATAVWDADTTGNTKSYSVDIGESPNTYTNKYLTTNTEAALLDLTFDKVYYVAVKGYNGTAESPYSNEVAFKVIKEVPVIQKYVVGLTSKDKGKTWIVIGQAVVPPPIVTGQLYKYNLNTISKVKYMFLMTSKDKGVTWKELGRILVPTPYVAGQKYKINIVNR
jgi:hypothetical protein